MHTSNICEEQKKVMEFMCQFGSENSSKLSFVQWKFVHKKECKHHHEFFYSIKYWPTNGSLNCKTNTILLNTSKHIQCLLYTGEKPISPPTGATIPKKLGSTPVGGEIGFSALYSKHSMCSRK